jgi:hypothetical protein
MTTAPLFFAENVRTRLGLSEPDFEYLRTFELEEGKDWLAKDGAILLTSAGLNAVLGHLQASGNAAVVATKLDDFEQVPAPEPEEKSDGGPLALRDTRPGDLIELTVKKLCPNERLLYAITPTGETVLVGVKANTNFRPKMKLKARLLRVDRYEFEGQLPRRPGTWNGTTR